MIIMLFDKIDFFFHFTIFLKNNLKIKKKIPTMLQEIVIDGLIDNVLIEKNANQNEIVIDVELRKQM